MQISLSEISAKLARAAGRFVTPDEARYFAELFVDSHLKKAPRMNPIQEAVDEMKTWLEAGAHEIKILAEKPGFSLYDFGGLAPSLKIKQLHDALEKKAKNNGVAALGLTNTAGITTLGMWADGLARRGLIGLAMFNGGVGCATPPGGAKGVLGTNPMAYAIPGDDGPISLDMATTEIPYFQIADAKQSGDPLPPGCAVDDDGLPTQDAAKAMDAEGVTNLLPMGGGFKGYSMVMLVEILSGALVQSPMSHNQTPGWHPPEYGCFLLALDTGIGGDGGTFSAEVAALGSFIKSHKPAKNGPGISLPGERGLKKQQEARRKGVLEIEQKLLAELDTLVE